MTAHVLPERRPEAVLAPAPARPLSAGHSLLDPRSAVSWVLPAFAVAGLAASQGGYFPRSWGWSAFALSWVAGLALALRSRIVLARLELAFLAALTAFVAWIGVSAAWSVTVPQTLLDLERGVVYIAGAMAVLLVARLGSEERILGGVLAGIAVVAAYSLATRLFPAEIGVYDPIATYRLSEPVGYWNTLGAFAAIAALLALGFAAFSRTSASRALAAAALVVLVTTLYFTFSRGAWLALGIGLAALFSLSPRRLALAAWTATLAPFAALAVWLASRSEGLTHQGAALSQASSDGRRLFGFVVALVASSAVVAILAGRLAERLRPSARLRRVAGGALLAGVVASGVFGLVAVGGPVGLVERGYAEFTAPPPRVVDLNQRLVSFSGNGRADLWALAWDNYAAHGWLGSGAGTYERYYNMHRPPTLGKVRDAHGLFIEVLSELGPVGLGLLVVALACPLMAGALRRQRSMVPVAVAGYSVYLAHAFADWDWEMTGLTLAAVFCGAAALTACRDRRAITLSPPARLGAVGLAAAVAVVAGVTFLGHSALEKSEAARNGRDLELAEHEARAALRFLPWYPRGWIELGRTRLAAGDAAGARESFQKAIDSDPGNWMYWLELARASSGDARARALARGLLLNPYSRQLASAGAGA